jgi:hypothetical protein
LVVVEEAAEEREPQALVVRRYRTDRRLVRAAAEAAEEE